LVNFVPVQKLVSFVGGMPAFRGVCIPAMFKGGHRKLSRNTDKNKKKAAEINAFKTMRNFIPIFELLIFFFSTCPE
jgi:hypothetical protein